MTCLIEGVKEGGLRGGVVLTCMSECGDKVSYKMHS